LYDYVLKKEKPPFVINHADLLSKDLIQDVDLVVFLNPKKEELLRTRQIRTESGTEGEWQSINPEDFDKIEKENLRGFKKLGGKIIYENINSGTIVKQIKR